MNYDKIGTRLKYYRIQLQKTQQELANQCGITKSFLSKIEHAKAIPSLGTLSKLAEGLNISVSDLVSEELEKKEWQYDSAGMVENGLCLVAGGYHIFPFADHLAHKKIQPFYYEVRRGEIKPHKNAHNGEEFFYIIEGELLFVLNGEEHHLSQGDGFYFNAAHDHQTIPLTEVVKILDIII